MPLPGHPGIVSPGAPRGRRTERVRDGTGTEQDRASGGWTGAGTDRPGCPGPAPGIPCPAPPPSGLRARLGSAPLRSHLRRRPGARPGAARRPGAGAAAAAVPCPLRARRPAPVKPRPAPVRPRPRCRSGAAGPPDSAGAARRGGRGRYLPLPARGDPNRDGSGDSHHAPNGTPPVQAGSPRSEGSGSIFPGRQCCPQGHPGPAAVRVDFTSSRWVPEPFSPPAAPRAVSLPGVGSWVAAGGMR